MNTEYNKALVALVMAVLGMVQWYTEFKLDFISSDGVMAIIAALTPALVWLVPNKAKPVVVEAPAPAPVETKPAA
jgi:hypothetical protein